MQVIDSQLASCYYDVSIIPYWTYEVQIVVRVAIWRGNQVQVLSDPVTVTEEFPFIIPLYRMYEKGKGSDDAEVRKPALYGEVKLPSKV